jgi:subtilisin family serine protease
LSVNAPQTLNSGTGVHIGIIDSIEHPVSRGGLDDLCIRNQESFIESPKLETIPHGSQVLSVVSYFSGESDYSLYQAVESDRTLRTEPFDRAVDAAIRDGVDILNISAGDPWPGPVGVNPSAQIIQRAVDNDITVVAAAGNSLKSGGGKPVHCPAAVEEVIAVGGLVTECTEAPSDVEPGDASAHPDGAYWAHKHDDEEYPPGVPNEIFCGQQGCNGSDCIKNQYERPWEGNTNPTGDKPDVLAPVHLPKTHPTATPFLHAGSSFAAPVVTGTVGMIFGELLEEGDRTPSAWKTREAVVSSAARIDKGDLQKLNVQRTLNELAPNGQMSYSD